MFHFMVVKESRPYFYFSYILKFKLWWKLWLVTEISFLLRLLSPAPFFGCVHVLGMFQLCMSVCVCVRFHVPATLLYKIPIIGFCSEIQLSNAEPSGHILVWRSPGRVKCKVLIFQAYCLGSSSIRCFSRPRVIRVHSWAALTCCQLLASWYPVLRETVLKIIFKMWDATCVFLISFYRKWKTILFKVSDVCAGWEYVCEFGVGSASSIFTTISVLTGGFHLALYSHFIRGICM